MAKKKINYTNPAAIKWMNKHSLGGWFAGLGSKLDGLNTNLTDSFFDSKFGQGLSGFGIKAGNIGGMANTAATAIGGLLAGQNKTGVGTALQGIGSLASNIPGVGGLIGAGVNLIGGLTNAAFGSNINKDFVNRTEAQARQQSNYVSGASDNASLLADWEALTFLDRVKKDDVGSEGWLSDKATDETNRLNGVIDNANTRALVSYNNTADNIDRQKDLMLKANYGAYGGPINMRYTGIMSPFGNRFDEGGPKNSIPTQEEYIAQQIAAKRAAALDKSRNRTEPVLPIINGIPNKNSCIYTATDNYGKKYRVPGNWTFYENPEKYGFTSIDINDAQAGDIIQVLDKGAPYHAMILDGYDEQGRPLYNYSRGSNGDSSDIVKSSTNFPNTKKLAYTFTGTPADSTQWINEYKEMYNKKADGGPLEGENSSNSNNKIKRKYIGGTKSEARKKYFNWDKELTQVVTNLATSYGISPSLAIDRLSHEGLIDYLIRDNNEYLSHNGDPNYPSDAFDMDDYNEPFGLLGLDYIFDTYTKGVTKTKRPINMARQVNHNERGELVNSAETKNLYDTLELFVAELASRRNQVKKQYPNLTDTELDSATSARYNASNRYFKQLMDSGEYKTEYPIDIEGVNIPTPKKTDSKYIQDQVQSINKSDVLDAFRAHSQYGHYLVDESIFTVGNKSYNPGLFIDEENYEFNSDSPLVDRFVDNYVNRNFSIPSKVKVVDDYYYEDDGKDMMYLNKKAEGGELFTNGVTTINNGGTHEENSYEGVQMGVDPQGIPNLVEEGEVIYDDYVFSNRLRVPKEVRQKYKLRGVTFADAAKQLQKESEERPNDPISKNGLEAAMQMLTNEQEKVRMEKENNKYAKGGRLCKKYEGTGPYSQYLELMPKLSVNIPKYDKGFMQVPTIESPVGTHPMEKSLSYTDFLVNKNKDNYKSLLPYTSKDSDESNEIQDSFLRKMPIAGHSIGVFSDLFSSPDYSAANRIDSVDIVPSMVGFTPVGNYLEYTPFDKDRYINTLNANTNAGKRAIMNTSGGNRAAAMAGLLSADYNHGNQLGELARKAEEYNLAQRQAVEQFNRGTNMTNAEMGLKAAMANADSKNKATQLRLAQAETVAKLEQLARDTYNTRRSNNLNVLLEDLEGLGTENWNRAWLDRLAKAGVLKIDSKGNFIIPKEDSKKSNGGRIKTKKKKGLTYG